MSPLKSWSSEDLVERSRCLGPELGFCLRAGGGMARAPAEVSLPQGVRPGAGFLVTHILFYPP